MSSPETDIFSFLWCYDQSTKVNPEFCSVRHLKSTSRLQMKDALSEIIQLATVDTEPWVLMVADILKSFPETGSLNLDLEEQNPNVQDILGELREKGQHTVLKWWGIKRFPIQLYFSFISSHDVQPMTKSQHNVPLTSNIDALCHQSMCFQYVHSKREAKRERSYVAMFSAWKWNDSCLICKKALNIVEKLNMYINMWKVYHLSHFQPREKMKCTRKREMEQSTYRI